MIFVSFGVLLSILAWLKGFYKSWKDYYPTVLFVVIGNLSCDLLLLSKPLWVYMDLIGKYMLMRILMMFILYSSTVVLFLALFPKKILPAVACIAIWTFLYAAVEGISLHMGLFTYYNGWTLLYTIIHNIVMFLLIILHHKKPFLAWSFSFLSAVALMLLFSVPFAV